MVTENLLSRISDFLDQKRHATEEYITWYGLRPTYLIPIDKFIMGGYFDNSFHFFGRTAQVGPRPSHFLKFLDNR